MLSKIQYFNKYHNPTHTQQEMKCLLLLFFTLVNVYAAEFCGASCKSDYSNVAQREECQRTCGAALARRNCGDLGVVYDREECWAACLKEGKEQAEKRHTYDVGVACENSPGWNCAHQCQCSYSNVAMNEVCYNACKKCDDENACDGKDNPEHIEKCWSSCIGFGEAAGSRLDQV